MTHKLKVTIFILVLLVITSCKEKNEDIAVEKVKFFDKSQFDSADKIQNIKYVKLEGNDLDSKFAAIDKIIIKDSLCYILDVSTKSIYIFNLDGQYLRKIEKVGKGPGEYVMPADFDVDENSNIVVLDGPGKKLIKYDINGGVCKSKKMEFNIGSIISLENSHYLLGLENFNTGKSRKTKYVVCNSDFEIINHYFEYDKNIDRNYQLESYFKVSEDGILHNCPIDNHVTLFNKKGDVIKKIQVDFGARNVPVKERRNIEKVVEKSNKYFYMAMTPLLVKDYLIGAIYKENRLATFMLNMKSNKVSINDYDPKTFSAAQLNFPLCTLNDSFAVSFINYNIHPNFENDAALDESMKLHLKEGNTILTIYEIK